MKIQSILVCCALSSGSLAAQGLSTEDSGRGTWDLALGAQLRYSPDYQGSEQSSAILAPMVQARYSSPMSTFRFGPLPGGLPALSYSPYETVDAALGIALGVDPGRSESAPKTYQPGSTRLAGMGEVAGTTVMAVFGRYRMAPFTLHGAYRSAIQSDQGHGGQVATVQLNMALPMPQGFSATAGVGLNWANQSYMQSMFGVTPVQSSKTGWATYSPKSGARDYFADIKLRYHAQQDMVWHTGLEWTQLVGEAANSPLVMSKMQTKATLGVTYHWQ